MVRCPLLPKYTSDFYPILIMQPLTLSLEEIFGFTQKTTCLAGYGRASVIKCLFNSCFEKTPAFPRPDHMNFLFVELSLLCDAKIFSFPRCPHLKEARVSSSSIFPMLNTFAVKQTMRLSTLKYFNKQREQ